MLLVAMSLAVAACGSGVSTEVATERATHADGAAAFGVDPTESDSSVAGDREAEWATTTAVPGVAPDNEFSALFLTEGDLPGWVHHVVSDPQTDPYVDYVGFAGLYCEDLAAALGDHAEPDPLMRGYGPDVDILQAVIQMPDGAAASSVP